MENQKEVKNAEATEQEPSRSTAVMCSDSGWINCTDKLPENTMNVLIFAGNVTIGWYWYNTKTWHERGVGYDGTCDNVTHWMPLPDPPNH